MAKSSVLAIVFALVPTGVAIADGPGKPFIYESTDAWTTAIAWSCADERLQFENHAIGRVHEFVTASKTYHYLESVSVTSLAVGVTTGRQWISQSHSVFRGLMKPGTGETFGFSFRDVYKPVDGVGPMFAVDNQYVVRLDAEGNLIAENEKGYEVDLKCLGPAK